MISVESQAGCWLVGLLHLIDRYRAGKSVVVFFFWRVDFVWTYRSLYALPRCFRSRRGWLCRFGRARPGLVGGLLRLRTNFRCEFERDGFVSCDVLAGIAPPGSKPSYWIMIVGHRHTGSLFGPKPRNNTNPTIQNSHHKRNKKQRNSPAKRIIPILLPLHARDGEDSINALRHSNDRHKLHQNLPQPPHQRLPVFGSLVLGSSD